MSISKKQCEYKKKKRDGNLSAHKIDIAYQKSIKHIEDWLMYLHVSYLL